MTMVEVIVVAVGVTVLVTLAIVRVARWLTDLYVNWKW